MEYVNRKILNSGYLKSLWGVDGNSFKKRLNYHIKTGKLTKLRKSLYIFSDQIHNLNDNDLFEIANSIYFPSYISFESALQYHGVSFQDWKTITVASKYNKTITIEKLGLKIQFNKIKEPLLYENIGLYQQGNFQIACAERTICDILAITGNFFFDNLESINVNLLQEISKTYSLYYKGFEQKVNFILQPINE